jgi:PAS domain S-box-containing protein
MKWNLTAEYLSLFFILILLSYSWGSKFSKDLKNYLFNLYLLFVFLEILMSIVSIIAIINFKSIPESLNLLIQWIYFCMTPLLSVLFTNYIIAVGWEGDKKLKSYMLVATLPYLILYIPFITSNLFTHVLFTINSSEGLVFGKLFILTYAIHFIYVLIMIVLAFLNKARVQKRLFFVFLSFPVIYLMIMIIQYYNPALILSGSAATIIALIVYLYIQDKQQDELKQSEERFRNLFTLKGDALFVIDRIKGDILEVNDSACSLYGYTRAEMLTLKNTDMSYEPSKTAQAAKDFNEGSIQIPIRYHKKKDGTVFPVEISATFFTWNNAEAILVVSKDITDRQIAENKLIYLSYHDQLTGLYNRRFFEEELIRLDAKRNLPISIAMGDVNGLKLVNDSFGHQKGDQLLMRVAYAMQRACREDDIIARLGGMNSRLSCLIQVKPLLRRSS